MMVDVASPLALSPPRRRPTGLRHLPICVLALAWHLLWSFLLAPLPRPGPLGHHPQHLFSRLLRRWLSWPLHSPEPLRASALAPCPKLGRRAPTYAGLPNTRHSHGTVQGCWSGTQLLEALHKLTEDVVHLNRMPGSGLQAKPTWNGRTVAVKCWQTGRVHVQGKGASSLAPSLSSLAFSTPPPPPVSPDASSLDSVATPPHDQESTSGSDISPLKQCLFQRFSHEVSVCFLLHEREVPVCLLCFLCFLLPVVFFPIRLLW